MLLGLRTVGYKVTDLAKAKEWWKKHFGITPYFDEPFYVGYNVGGFELGLDPAEGSAKGPGGVVAYWGVENAEKALARLQEAGAKVHSGLQDVGGGIRVASVSDPFGNLIGIIENPNFKLPR